MFKNLFNQTLVMCLAPDGNDGGGETTTIKFGGVEVPIDDLPEETVGAIKKANEAYKASSTAGIKAAQELKEKEAVIAKLKEEKIENNGEGTGLTKDEIDAYFETKMTAVNQAVSKSEQINLSREIEKSNEVLRQEFSYLDDETFNEAMKTVDATFKSQDPNVRSKGMYKNIAEVTLGKALRKNIGNIDSNAAMEKIMSDPATARDFITKYAKEAGIDVNLPEGGFTDQATFTDKVSELQTQFKSERDPVKRGRIVQKIADVQAEGTKYGFKF